ncbi:MAG: septum formation initiator family protein [Bacteroidales bacterium]|jgi:cell division protein FtsB|nr:septum formation initiator family protein [Bacteroidales bacterium]MDD2570929.1 septum formation initiator family protein [Bacteroidales bacterium]MDD2812864.1 septum formation initiator family protein [Bacteroidales bacterium]MDD3385978.1 septum formation initiator family protein [Bacteroidales bacterium]MDD3810903.1 septum formation initiator family protein [Bacteroidales bacterium]
MQKSFFHTLWSVVSNKYLIALIVFGVWIVFFDQHNLVDRHKTKGKLIALKSDTTYYYNKIQEDLELIKELKTSPENLEKFAREQYLMKRPDEDVFIILKK